MFICRSRSKNFLKDLASTPKKKSSRNAFFTRLNLLAVAFLLSLAFFPLATRAFTEPRSTPTKYVPFSGVNEIPSFLNASAIGQIKTGTLSVGDRSGRIPNCSGGISTGCSRLCLNADPVNGTVDANCITNWSDLSGSISGSYLSLLPDNSATVNRGYSRIKADVTAGQLISLITEPNRTSGGTALRANGFSDSNYAGLFAGTVFIGNAANNAQLCLNDASTDGNPPGTCITRWSNVINPASTALIYLQDMTARSSHTPEQGSAATVGPFMVPSLVLGITTSSIPTPLSCGDSICQIANETHASCAVDCP